MQNISETIETGNEHIIDPAVRGDSGNVQQQEKPEKPKILRNPDGTFPKGVSGNPAGKPKGTMKDFLRRKLCDMTDEEKEAFVKGISAFDLIRLAEGNPHNTTDVTSDNKPLQPILVEFINAKEDSNT